MHDVGPCSPSTHAFSPPMQPCAKHRELQANNVGSRLALTCRSMAGTRIEYLLLASTCIGGHAHASTSPKYIHTHDVATTIAQYSGGTLVENVRRSRMASLHSVHGLSLGFLVDASTQLSLDQIAPRDPHDHQLLRVHVRKADHARRRRTASFGLPLTRRGYSAWPRLASRACRRLSPESSTIE